MAGRTTETGSGGPKRNEEARIGTSDFTPADIVAHYKLQQAGTVSIAPSVWFHDRTQEDRFRTARDIGAMVIGGMEPDWGVIPLDAVRAVVATGVAEAAEDKVPFSLNTKIRAYGGKKIKGLAEFVDEKTQREGDPVEQLLEHLSLMPVREEPSQAVQDAPLPGVTSSVQVAGAGVPDENPTAELITNIRKEFTTDLEQDLALDAAEVVALGAQDTQPDQRAGVAMEERVTGEADITSVPGVSDKVDAQIVERGSTRSTESLRDRTIREILEIIERVGPSPKRTDFPSTLFARTNRLFGGLQAGLRAARGEEPASVDSPKPLTPWRDSKSQPQQHEARPLVSLTIKAAGDLAPGQMLRVSSIDPFSHGHQADTDLAQVPLFRILGRTQAYVATQRKNGGTVPSLLNRDEKIAKRRPHIRLYVAEFGSYGACAPDREAMAVEGEEEQLERARLCEPCPVITICYARRAQDLLDAVEGQPNERHQEIMAGVMGDDVRAGMTPSHFVSSVLNGETDARRIIHEVAEVQQLQDQIHQWLAGR